MIINARIESFYLGLTSEFNTKDDAFVLDLTLNTERGMAKLGDYILDKEDFNADGFYVGRTITANLGCAVLALLDITGMQELREIQGAYIRCELSDKDGESFKIVRIGHILQDKWIDLSSWLK